MDPTTLTMIAVGAVIGILTMSNWSLRREVHSLRQQVAALVNILEAKGFYNAAEREALGRLGGARSVDPYPGRIRGGGGHFTEP
jgi:hypothetical protein